METPFKFNIPKFNIPKAVLPGLAALVAPVLLGSCGSSRLGDRAPELDNSARGTPKGSLERDMADGKISRNWTEVRRKIAIVVDQPKTSEKKDAPSAKQPYEAPTWEGGGSRARVVGVEVEVNEIAPGPHYVDAGGRILGGAVEGAFRRPDKTAISIANKLSQEANPSLKASLSSNNDLDNSNETRVGNENNIKVDAGKEGPKHPGHGGH